METMVSVLRCFILSDFWLGIPIQKCKSLLPPPPLTGWYEVKSCSDFKRSCSLYKQRKTYLVPIVVFPNFLIFSLCLYYALQDAVTNVTGRYGKSWSSCLWVLNLLTCWFRIQAKSWKVRCKELPGTSFFNFTPVESGFPGQSNNGNDITEYKRLFGPQGLKVFLPNFSSWLPAHCSLINFNDWPLLSWKAWDVRNVREAF